MKTKQTLVCGARNLCFALAAIFALAFIACDDGSGDDKTDAKKFTVTFNSDGGSDVDAQTITKGDKAAKPADPTKAWTGTLPAGLHTGMPDRDHFDGWQKDGAAYDFDTPVTADITLTAKWTAPNPTPIDVSARTGTDIIAKAVAYINADTSGTTEYTLVLDADVENVAAITHNKDGVTLEIISIDDTEVVISKGTATGRVFTVGGANANNPHSAKLVIDGTVTLQGKSGINYVVCVGFGGSLELKGNAKITGNTNSSSGGGVYAEGSENDRVTITMSGNAEVSNNISSSTGTSNTFGGGVYLYRYADLTMNDNASIKNNTVSSATNACGGGVSINNNCTLTMNGGEISGNTATSSGSGSNYARGGGVFINGTGKLIVASEAVKANIKNNTVTNTGGGTTSAPQVYGVFTVGGVNASSF